jgi:hypothetical protein
VKALCSTCCGKMVSAIPPVAIVGLERRLLDAGGARGEINVGILLDVNCERMAAGDRLVAFDWATRCDAVAPEEWDFSILYGPRKAW